MSSTAAITEIRTKELYFVYDHLWTDMCDLPWDQYDRLTPPFPEKRIRAGSSGVDRATEDETESSRIDCVTVLWTPTSTVISTPYLFENRGSPGAWPEEKGLVCFNGPPSIFINLSMTYWAVITCEKSGAGRTELISIRYIPTAPHARVCNGSALLWILFGGKLRGVHPKLSSSELHWVGETGTCLVFTHLVNNESVNLFNTLLRVYIMLTFKPV